MSRAVKADCKITKYKNGERTEVSVPVAVEAPVRIMLNGGQFITLQCTPGDLEDLPPRRRQGVRRTDVPSRVRLDAVVV